MKIIKIILCALFVMLVSVNMCFGHACHDPWRPTPVDPGDPGGEVPPPPPPPPPPPSPDPLTPAPPPVGPGAENQPAAPDVVLSDIPQVITPSESLYVEGIFVTSHVKQIKLVNKKSTFKIAVENKTNQDFYAVKLSAASKALDIKVKPKSILRLLPGEKAYFTLNLTLKQNFSGKKYGLTYTILSRGKEIYSGKLDNAGKRSPNKISILSEKKVVKMLSKGEFKLLVKNNSAKTIKNISMQIKDKDFDVINITPLTINKIAPGEKKEVLVKLKLKKGASFGAQFIKVKAKLRDKNIILGSTDISLRLFPYKLNVTVSKDKSKPNQYKFSIKNPNKKELKAIKFSARCKAFDVKISPNFREKIAPGKTVSFSISLTRKKKVAKGTYYLRFKVFVNGVEALLNVSRLKLVLK